MQSLESFEMMWRLCISTGVSRGNRGSIPFRCLCFLLFFSFLGSAKAADRTFGVSKRVPWTTSRLTGSPDPPPPYKIVRAFPKLTFKNPLLLRNAPGTERLFIGEQEGKLYSFPNDPVVGNADVLLAPTTASPRWAPTSMR